MYCPNCTGNLVFADKEKLLSQDYYQGDYFTHQCEGCKVYWHLHFSGANVVLIATDKNETVASFPIVTDLKNELQKRVDSLSVE